MKNDAMYVLSDNVLLKITTFYISSYSSSSRPTYPIKMWY